MFPSACLFSFRARRNKSSVRRTPGGVIQSGYYMSLPHIRDSTESTPKLTISSHRRLRLDCPGISPRIFLRSLTVSPSPLPFNRLRKSGIAHWGPTSAVFFMNPTFKLRIVLTALFSGQSCILIMMTMASSLLMLLPHRSKTLLLMS